MRLWHTYLLEYLPKGQLLAQWRELNSIYVKEDNHVLINYIYEYPKEDLYIYSLKVIEEMEKRGYKIRSFEKMDTYFKDLDPIEVEDNPFKNHHNDEYLLICYYNLKEKFIRGQKDYEEKQYNALCKYILDAGVLKQP